MYYVSLYQHYHKHVSNVFHYYVTIAIILFDDRKLSCVMSLPLYIYGHYISHIDTIMQHMGLVAYKMEMLSMSSALNMISNGIYQSSGEL